MNIDGLRVFAIHENKNIESFVLSIPVRVYESKLARHSDHPVIQAFRNLGLTLKHPGFHSKEAMFLAKQSCQV
jgi:hypothetical protein